jgi:hypothetical protein
MDHVCGFSDTESPMVEIRKLAAILAADVVGLRAQLRQFRRTGLIARAFATA